MRNRRRILVIDDNHEVLLGASIRLRNAGYETLVALDAGEGISSAIREHPDAILLDVRMPGMDGLTALGELKRRTDTRDIPIVMLSASVVDQKAALDAGARFFLSKPYQGRNLIDAIQLAIADTEPPHDN
jgi:CheY-like chemotaxis protein